MPRHHRRLWCQLQRTTSGDAPRLIMVYHGHHLLVHMIAVKSRRYGLGMMNHSSTKTPAVKLGNLLPHYLFAHAVGYNTTDEHKEQKGTWASEPRGGLLSQWVL
jgi:hypothetical protein